MANRQKLEPEMREDNWEMRNKDDKRDGEEANRAQLQCDELVQLTEMKNSVKKNVKSLSKIPHWL